MYSSYLKKGAPGCTPVERHRPNTSSISAVSPLYLRFSEKIFRGCKRRGRETDSETELEVEARAFSIPYKSWSCLLQPANKRRSCLHQKLVFSRVVGGRQSRKKEREKKKKKKKRQRRERERRRRTRRREGRILTFAGVASVEMAC